MPANPIRYWLVEGIHREDGREQVIEVTGRDAAEAAEVASRLGWVVKPGSIREKPSTPGGSPAATPATPSPLQVYIVGSAETPRRGIVANLTGRELAGWIAAGVARVALALLLMGYGGNLILTGRLQMFFRTRAWDDAGAVLRILIGLLLGIIGLVWLIRMAVRGPARSTRPRG